MPKTKKESNDPSPKKSSHDLGSSKSKDSQVHPSSFFKNMTLPFLVGAGKAMTSGIKCYLGQSKKKSTSKRKIVKSSKSLVLKEEIDSSPKPRQSSSSKEITTKKVNVIKKSKKHRKFRPMDTLRDDWATYSKLKGCSKLSIDAKKIKKNKKSSTLFQINKEESSRVSFFSTMMNFKAFTITKNSEEMTQISDTFQGMVADFDKQFLQGLQNADQKFKFRLSREPPQHKTNKERPFFDSQNDDWNTFNTILKAYLKVNNIPKKRWNQVLLNSLDSPTYKFLKDICHLEQMDKMTFEELFDILDNHFLSTSEEDIIRVLSKEKYMSKMGSLEKCRKADPATLDQSVRKKILWSDQELKRNRWKNDDPTDSRWCNGNTSQNDLNEPGVLKSNMNDVKKTTKTKLPIVKSLDSTVPPADGRNMIKKSPAVTGILIDKRKERVKSKVKPIKPPNRENAGSPRKSVTFDPKLERIKHGKQQRIHNVSRVRKTPENGKRIKTPDKTEEECCPSPVPAEPVETGKTSDQPNMSSIGELEWDQMSDQMRSIKTEDIKTLDEPKPKTPVEKSSNKAMLIPFIQEVNRYLLPEMQSEQKPEINATNKSQYLRDIKEQIFSALNHKKNDNLASFNTKTESWDVFKEQLNTHLALKRVPYEKWVEFLISTLDSDTKHILDKLSSPLPPEKKKFTDVMIMLDEHFNTIANEKNAVTNSVTQNSLESYKLKQTGVLIYYYKHGDWSKFKPKIEKHMIDTGLPKSQWAVELLSRLDNKTYKILTYICDPIPPYRKSYEELVDIFDNEPAFVSKDNKEKKRFVRKLEDRHKTKEYLMTNDAKILFDPGTGSWEDFKFKLKTYLEGKAIEKSKWTFELLSRLDPHTYSMVKDKCFTTTPLQMSFESLIEIIDEHFQPSKPPRAEDKNEIQINQRFGSSGDWLSLKKAANKTPNKKVDRWTFALLCGLDCKSYQLLEQACAPDLPEDKRFEELVEILDKYVLAMPTKSKPSISVKEEDEIDRPKSPVKVMTSKERTTKEMTSKEKTSKDMTSKEMTSKEMTSKERTSKEMTSKEIPPKIIIPKQFTPNEIKSKEMPATEITSQTIPSPTLPPPELLISTKDVFTDSNKQKRKKQGKRTDSLWTLALLNGLNDKVHHLLNALCEPELPNKKSFEEIVDLLDKFLIPMPHKSKSKLKKKTTIGSDNTKFFHYSRIPPFDSKHGEWKTYRKSLTVNFELFDIPKDKWSLAFLSKLDDSVFRKLQTICDPIPPYKKSFQDLLEIVDSLFLFKLDVKSDPISELSWVSSTSSSAKPSDWKTFKEDLKNTLESCQMAKDKWVDILLRSVDAETYKLLQELCKPYPPEFKTFEELMSVIDHHFLPPPNIHDEEPSVQGEPITVYHCQQHLCTESQKLNDNIYNNSKTYKMITSKEIPHSRKPQLTAEKPFEEFSLLGGDPTDLQNGNEIKISNFNPKEENWFVFKQRLIRDLDILKHPKELWNEVLVQKLDLGTVQILREASKPSRLEHKTFDELVSILDGYFVPEKALSCLSNLGERENNKLPSSNQIEGFASKIKHWSGYRDRVKDNFKELGIPEKVTSELVKGLDDVMYEVLQSLCEAQYNLKPFKDLCSNFNKEDAEVQTEKGTGLQNFPSFDFITGDWKVYKERLTNHLVLYDTPVEKWSYALLSVLNGKDYDTLKQLCSPHFPEEKTLKELMSILDGFFTVNEKNKSEFIKHCLKREQDCLIAFKDKLKEDVKMLSKLPSQFSLKDKHEKFQLAKDNPSLTHLKNYLQTEISEVSANIIKERSKKKTLRKWKL